MRKISFKDFMKKYNLKNDIMIERELQRIYIYPLYPRDSKLYSDKVFANIDDGRMNGTHWTCFPVKYNKSYYFDSFGGQPDKFLLNHLPKPITYHNYKIQGIKSQLCSSYCLYFFYLNERMNYYDAILKRYSEKLSTNISNTLFSVQKKYSYNYNNSHYMNRGNYINIDNLFIQV